MPSKMASGQEVYYSIENFHLWTMSDKIGCAVNIPNGVMEYWKAGMLGLAE